MAINIPRTVLGTGRLLAALVLLSLLLSPHTAVADEPSQRTVRVAAFYYPPAILKGIDGAMQGWYVDLLKDISVREKLQIEYVYGSWAEGLERARRGEVDLVTSVAWTAERATFLDYGKQPLLTVWGELFVPEDSKVDGILQMAGKSVAVMRNDYNGKAFREMAGKFEIDCRYVELDSFEEVLQAIDGHQVDAGVVNRVVGASHHKNYRIKETGIIFNPFDIYFAVPKGHNPELLNLLDRYLTSWRADKSSIYYQSRFRWFGRDPVVVQPVPAALYYSLIAFGVGIILAVLWVATLRRQVRRAIKQEKITESRFRSAIEEAPFPTMLHASDGRVLNVNRAWREITGYSLDDIPTIAEWTRRAYGTEGPVVEEYIQNTYSLEEREQEGEFVITCRDGSQRTWDFSSMSLGETFDGRRMAISMANDITSRKLNEDELRHNESRLQAITSIFQYRADTLQQLLDYALTEAIKLSGSQFGYIYHYSEETRQFTLNSWSNEVMKSCTIVEQQTIYDLDKTGLWGEAVRQRRAILVNDFHAPNPMKKGYPEGHAPLDRFLTVPVFSDGQIVAVVGVANKSAPYTNMDVLQLNLFMDGLWKLIERRQAEDDLQAQNAEMERFLYTVSHDLKSPIVTLKGFLELLEIDLKAGDEEKINRDIGFMKSAANRMNRLLEEVLELSRIGRVSGSIETIPYSELIRESLIMVGGAIEQSKVELAIAPSSLLLSGDRNRLIEIWQNLLENAIKYRDSQTSLRIEVGIEGNVDAPIFFVRDNGLGIDPQYQEKIFRLFEKLNPSSEGTGLGLALVKRIVESYGGRIWVESAGEGMGSCFYFTLPKAVAQKRGDPS